MDLIPLEQDKYQAILTDVHLYLDTLSPPLRAICHSYIGPLSERAFVKMMSLLPYWLVDCLQTDEGVNHQLGLAHFYCCWYYHAQDDLLDEETSTATVLGAHLALLKMVEIYQGLGVTTSSVWSEFQRLSQTSAETYALEMTSRFRTLDELTLERLAGLTLTFVGDRVTPFYFNTVAQCHLAGLAPDHPTTIALTTALRCTLAARQIGDDAGDWLEDLQAGQLTYVTAHLIRRVYDQQIIAPTQELTLERLAAYQVRDEPFWLNIEQTTYKLHQQALAALADFAADAFRCRLIETQIAQHTIGWEMDRTRRATWRQMFGLVV